MQATTSFLKTRSKADYSDLSTKFGSLSSSMLVLLKSMSGGMDWGEVSDTLEDLGDVYVGLFVFFIVFSIFGVMNVVTAIFVDTALTAAEADRDSVIAEMLNQADSYMS